MTKKPKKRGVKPGTKRGPYRTAIGRVTLAEMDKAMGYLTKPNILSLCGHVEQSLIALENRISNLNARIQGLL